MWLQRVLRTLQILALGGGAVNITATIIEESNAATPDIVTLGKLVLFIALLILTP